MWTFAAALVAAVVSIVTLALTRRWAKADKHDEIVHELRTVPPQLRTLEKDGCRTQLLLLIADYPNERAEIMKLAKHYFAVLKGDWYLTNLFNRWLEKEELGKPEWFRPED